MIPNKTKNLWEKIKPEDWNSQSNACHGIWQNANRGEFADRVEYRNGSRHCEICDNGLIILWVQTGSDSRSYWNMDASVNDAKKHMQ